VEHAARAHTHTLVRNSKLIKDLNACHASEFILAFTYSHTD